MSSLHWMQHILISRSAAVLKMVLLHQQLQSMFGLITLDTMHADGIFKSVSGYPLHHFTPFYKLVV
jgi:hypothetical protein